MSVPHSLFFTRQNSTLMHSEKVNKGHDILVFLVFLVISFCLWLLKVSNEDFETNVVMNVIVEEVPDGLELQEDDIELNVGVKAKGSKLLAYVFGKAGSIEVAFSDFADDDGVLSIETSKLANKVEAAMPPGFSFKYFADESLIVYVKKESVSLPVKFDSNIVAGKNVEYGGVELHPEKVTVMAPPSMLEGLEFVSFKSIPNIKVLKDTVLEYTLPQKKYMAYEPSVLTVKIKASPYSNIKVMRKLQILDMPLSHIAKLYGFPDSIEVSCLIPPSMASKVAKEHFKVSAHSSDVRKGTKDTLFLNVGSLPSFVKEDNVKLQPEYIILDNIKPFSILNIFN